MLGDSHSTYNLFVSPQNSFWGLAATALGVDTVINCSRPKLSFDSVCQILIGEQQRYNFDTDFFIIGVPPLERITVFDNHADTPLKSSIINTTNWLAEDSNITSHHGLINLQHSELDKNSMLLTDRSWIETQALRQVFLITQWLDSQNANYVIVNLNRNLDKSIDWRPSQYILDYCLNHPRCELFGNSLYSVNLGINRPVDFDKFGWNGHHGQDGNRHFFETSIKDKLC
jgi:hypothetical protein